MPVYAATTPNADGSGTVTGLAIGTGASTVCAGDDSRLSDARAPNGNAGGDLAGTYPNPTVKASVSLTTPVLGVAGGTSLKLSGGFCCNGIATPQTALASGGAAPAGGTGTAAGGYDTAAHRNALITLVNNIRTALVNNGIMS